MDNQSYESDERNENVYSVTGDSRGDKRTNYLVEVNSRRTTFRKTKLYKRILILSFVIITILLIGFITVLCILISEIKKPLLCTDVECLKTASRLKFTMQPKTDPCDDFYDFACGNWGKEHPSHGWFPQFSTFDEIREIVINSVINFLSSEPEENYNNSSEPVPVEQSRIFYKSCTDTDVIDDLGFTAMYKHLENIGLPKYPAFLNNSLKDNENYNFDWLRVEVTIKKILAMDVFTGFIIDQDRLNVSQNVIMVGTPGIPCPLPSPFKQVRKKLKNYKEENYTNNYDILEIRAGVEKKIMKHVISAISKDLAVENIDDETLNNVADVIYNVTYDLIELSENHTAEDYVGIPRTLEYLQNITDMYLGSENTKIVPDLWQTYLDYIFEESNITITSEDYLYIDQTEEPYLPKIMNYLLNKPPNIIELYMWYVSVLAMIMNTTSDMMNFITKQTIQFSFVPKVESREIECASLVTNFMGIAVTYGIADRTFVNKTKPKVEQMLNDIKHSFIETINSVNWMDSETKQASLDKTKEMISFIGFPDWLFQKESLENYYKNISIQQDTFLDNMMSIIRKIFPNRVESLRKVNHKKWRTDPLTVNAYNSFPDNAIYIPLAILAFPYYHLGLECLNYGAMGSILGHEITHGFDNTGRNYNKYGNYVQWWSNKTIEAFESRTECFVEQYNNYTIEGIAEHINGKTTLGENLADNGGLNNAYRAYQKYRESHAVEQKLPGFENFTCDQLFFIAYANIWCGENTLQNLEEQIHHDEHCPHKIRVLGTLRNSRDFAKVYKCAVGSNMNPNKKKCRLW